MAIRKLETREGNLLLGGAFFGCWATNPPEGIAANIRTCSDENLIRLSINWSVEKDYEGPLPLEFLRVRLGDFNPEAMFIGGRKYETINAGPVRGQKLGFPYDTYYKFRINARASYDAALFSKMPIACWQGSRGAFAVVFPKFLTLPHGRLPLFIRASGVRTQVEFSAAILNSFELQRKRFGWFGGGVNRKTVINTLTKNRSIEADFLMVAGDTWVECVRACEESLNQNPREVNELPIDEAMGSLGASLKFYDKVWDNRNHAHMHLPVKDVPRFESVEFKHSHVTDDLTKLVLYRRLIQSGYSELEGREQKLLDKLTDKSYLYKLGGADLWHTTTFFDGKKLRAFSHHGVGFVGFPGGMATITRRLFEYCHRNPNDSFLESAMSSANWILRGQAENGSWPAIVVESDIEPGPGCVASTAEAVRALLAAHRQAGLEEYRIAARRGLEFINREQSFFDCRQYLRDVEPDEADGITAEACIHANLDRRELTEDESMLEQAEKWGYYALQWVRLRSPEYLAEPSFDGLSGSITPRIDVWGQLLIARAFLRLSKATGATKWWKYAWRLFENVSKLQERDGGFCETWFLDYPSGLESIHIEPSFVADAFIEFLLDAYCDNEKNPFVDALSANRDSVAQRFPPLSPIYEQQPLVDISSDQPEWIIDNGLRLRLVFDGVYDRRSQAVWKVYELMRRSPAGRRMFKLGPAAKILLDRHRLSRPPKGIGETCAVRMTGVLEKRPGEERRTRRYGTSFHNIDLSIASTGSDAEGFPGADLKLDVETLCGDIRARQVRIDLVGRYEIMSVRGKEQILLSFRGNEYSIEIVEGQLDAIIREGGRAAIDISLCSNWNFFGNYRMSFRVTRRTNKTVTSG